MIFVLKAMRIGKMSSCASKLSGKTVHHFHKFICGTAYMFCNGRSCIIGGIDQKAVKQLVHGDLVAFHKTCNL